MSAINDNKSQSKDGRDEEVEYKKAADDNMSDLSLSDRERESDQKNTDEVPTQITPVPTKSPTSAELDEIETDAVTRIRERPEPESPKETAPSAPADEKPEVDIWGDFEIYETIGQGGMGTVYKGRQISLDRLVAVKVLPNHLAEDEKFLKRFDLEAKALARISSPHVVQVIAAGKHEDQRYFVMEFIAGNDLSERIKMGFRPTFRESIDIVQQAARGLAAANEYDIIHRDIKPGNIMMTRKGLVKITDFGLVKVISGEVTDLTMAGTAMGTVSYFSPEQGRGDYCDHRTDIYALGVVLYQLLTGVLPFRGDNPTSVIYQHNHVQPVAPRELVPEIPEEYQALVLRCLQKSPKNRYQTANDLIAEIEQLKEGKGLFPGIIDLGNRGGEVLTVAEEPRPKRRKRHISRRFIAVVSTIFIFLVVLLAIGMYIMKSDYVSRKQARKLLSQGKFIQSREVIDSHLAIAPSNMKWIVLQRRLIKREVKYFIELASAQFNRGHFTACRNSAHRVLEIIPDHRHAFFLLGRLEKRDRDLEQTRKFLSEGDYSLSRDLAESYLGVNPDDPDWLAIRAELNVIEGESLLQIAKREFAANEFKDARTYAVRALILSIDKKPAELFIAKLDKRDGQLEHARILIEQEQFDGSRKVIDEGVAASPDDPVWAQLLNELNQREGEKTLELAVSEFDRFEYEIARTHINRVLELLPNNQDARSAAASYEERDRVLAQTRADIDKERFLEARRSIIAHRDSWRNDQIWTDLLDELNQREEEWALQQAQAALKGWDTEASRANAMRVLGLYPENKEAKAIIGRIEERSKVLARVQGLIEHGDFTESRKLITTNLENAPDDPAWAEFQAMLDGHEGNLLLLKARTAYDTGDYEVAAASFRHALELMPGHVATEEMVRRFDERERTLKSIDDLRLQGDFSGGRQTISDGAAAWPNDPAWGLLLEQIDDAEARESLDTAREQWSQGKFSDSRRSALRVLELRPGNQDAIELIERITDREGALRKAKRLLVQGDYQEFQEIVDAELLNSPRDPDWMALRKHVGNAVDKGTVPAGSGISQKLGDELRRAADESDPALNSSDKTAEKPATNIGVASGIPRVDTRNADSSGELLAGSQYGQKTRVERKVERLRMLLGKKTSNFPAIEKIFESVKNSPSISPKELQELRSLVTDLRREHRLNKLLHRLDAAVRNGNRARLVMMLQDRNHAVALSSLMGQPGLVFEHTLKSFRIEDDQVIAVVVMRHALSGLPETDIFYEYRLQKRDNTWVIIEVGPVSQANGEQ